MHLNGQNVWRPVQNTMEPWPHPLMTNQNLRNSSNGFTTSLLILLPTHFIMTVLEEQSGYHSGVKIYTILTISNI